MKNRVADCYQTVKSNSSYWQKKAFNYVNSEQKELTFLGRSMILASLPYTKLETNEYQRVNGDYTLRMINYSDIGLPYGIIPRLILAYITLEVRRKGTNEIDLGKNISTFLNSIELGITGGKNGGITRFKDQQRRLFSTSFSCWQATPNGHHVKNSHIAEYWWDPFDINENWHPKLILSDSFHRDLLKFSVPLQVDAIRLLRRSPLSFDLYAWLVHRLGYLEKPVNIKWNDLNNQFGGTCERLNDFKKSFSESLERVKIVYPQAAAILTENGLMLKPSNKHISSK